MDQEKLEREIEQLESALDEMKAATPAHESSGLHAMRIVELEDELDERKAALQGKRRPGETSSSLGKGKH